MRIPRALMTEIERVGRMILLGELTYDEAVDRLEPFLDKDEFRLLVQEVLRKFLRNQVKAWISAQVGAAAEDEERGQQTLLFPDLPPWLEVSPATRKHQNAMTQKDWDAAVVQAQTKALNAAGYLERVTRARDRVRALSLAPVA